MEETTVTEPAADIVEEVPQEEKHQEIDPGQFEGLPEEKEKYGKRVQSRIDELTKNYREQERLVAEREAEIERLKASQKPQDAPESTIVTPPIPEPAPVEKKPDLRHEKLIELKAERAVALEELDGKKAAQISDKIDDLIFEIASEKQTVNVDEISKVVKQTEMDTAVASFRKRNEWFDTNTQMRGAAIALEAEMLPSWKSDYPSLLEEIGKQVTETFSPKLPEAQLSAVAGVSQVKSTKSKKTVELTDVQKKVAYAAFGHTEDPIQAYTDSFLKLQGAN